MTTDMYEKNDSGSAGCYIYYCVDVSNGTIIGGGGVGLKVFEDPASAGDLSMNGILAATTTNVVLVTVDADLTEIEVNSFFVNGTTDLCG